MSWAGKNNGKITNQFTAGGNKKAGIAGSVGRGQFAYIALGLRAPATIPSPANYLVSGVNQLSGGIGRRTGVFMNTRSIGGPNQQVIAMGRARVRAGPPMWF